MKRLWLKEAMQKNSSMTIIEIILYISMMGILMLGIFMYTFRLIDYQKEIVNQSELVSAAQTLMHEIGRHIRGAKKVVIETSVLRIHPGVLTLEKANLAENPTIFVTSGQNLFLILGENPPISLNQSQISIENLIFNQRNSPKSPDSIEVNLEIKKGQEQYRLINSFTVRNW